jgi:hypothetical protein
MVSQLRPEKDPTLPSSHRPVIILFDTVGILFQNTLLTKVLQEVNQRGLLRDVAFGFQPSDNTTLQLACPVESGNRNFDERWLTGAVFPYVTKAFETVRVKRFLHKLAVLKFLSYLVRNVSSYLECRSFQTSFQAATSRRGVMRTRVSKMESSSPLCCSVCM